VKLSQFQFFLFLGLILPVVGLASPVKLTLAQVSKLEVTERVRFYQNFQPKNLANLDEFIPALIYGLKDPDDVVRAAAFGNTVYVMIGLQEMKQQGQPMPPLTVADIQRLQQALLDGLKDKLPEVRGTAMVALIYSGPRNPMIEQALSTTLSHESDQQLRVGMAKEMALAGYNDPMAKEGLVAALDNPDSKVREEAAKAIAVVRPSGALDKLVVRLGDPEMMRDFVVDATAAYGAEASLALPMLEKMLADPSLGGTLNPRIREAIASIKNPESKLAVPAPIRMVSLVDSVAPTE